MKKRLSKCVYAAIGLLVALPFLTLNAWAAPTKVHNVMTGDQTNVGMIIGVSIAGGVALLAILFWIIFAIWSKKKKEKEEETENNNI